ncbi:hypothetical protein BofuT4_uP011910.1 [Botrytis cinerea T4]|uniref:Uncharacterized protein n=1 Tax=Botryotinia fuckeliana (strain T4) TaxID=999810 RepID=G2XS78_BOTF4|nr:hypothetical protein BofuT4_uP011910.1 [Botrytis cinerea T4]
MMSSPPSSFVTCDLEPELKEFQNVGSSLSVCLNLARIANKIGAPRMVNLNNGFIKPYENSSSLCDRTGHQRIVDIKLSKASELKAHDGT